MKALLCWCNAPCRQCETIEVLKHAVKHADGSICMPGILASLSAYYKVPQAQAQESIG